MSTITLFNSNLTMTSREIAELTGKRHDHVLRDIKTMLSQVHDLQDNPEMGYEVIQGVTFEFDSHTKRLSTISLDKDHTLTLLTGYDAKARFKVIRRWQELEVAAALTLHSDAYTLPYQPAMKIQFFELAMRTLRVSETSKIRMLAQFGESEGFNSNFLPDYVDEPLVRAITPLLKEMGHDLSSKVAKTVNPALEAMGILEHLSRKSTGSTIKKFWSLTEEGLQYGRNETSPNNPRERQPLFSAHPFPELLARLEAYLDANKHLLT